LYRVLREACTDDISEILVDTVFAQNRVQQLLQNWHMKKNIEVSVYKGTEPLLVATDIHKEIKTALQTKVNLPSGGYLYIQTTEALTVIDVNSGKFVSSATQDETILRTNKESIHEIARQLRLRNIGGMIIVDFIDMNSRVDKLAILEEFELALEPDKSKPQIGQLSDLGLVELTRHRQGQSLAELFTKKCPHCQGTGYMMDDFKFSSPTAEGEYRAKAAKLKLPVSNFKKNNSNNNNFKKDFNPQNKVQNQVRPDSRPDNLVEGPSVVQNDSQIENQVLTQGENVIVENTPQQENRNRNNNNRNRNKFNKNRNNERFPSENQEQGVVQQPAEEKAPQEFKPQNLQPQVLEPQLVTPQEVKPQIAPAHRPHHPKAKPPVVKNQEAQQEAKPQEIKLQESAAQEPTAEEKPKKPTRRPNRNTSKKSKPKDTEVQNEEPSEKKD